MSEACRHLDDERLLIALYGAGKEEDSAHLQACPECAARLRRLEGRRAAWLSAPAPAPDASRLRAQREAVFRQIERSRRPLWVAVRAGALACAILAAVLLQRPAAPPAEMAAAPALSDQQLFEDLATMIARDTPMAAEPLMALFTPQAEMEMQNQ
ncbi:MAG: hypothetical protein WHT08_03385 [Bryobacteraceae bacterium]|jgi:anti-sigma factor RsiW